MFLETVGPDGLAHLSYVIGDEDAGECAVIDPRRDVDVYLELARRREVRITHILETHIHADFVSGSRELAARTAAPIHCGASADYTLEHRAVEDGDVLAVGGLALRVLHTPGHTPEHVCFLVSGGRGADAPWGLFTGDTLFAGEVGRPDLLGRASAERLARRLHHSLHDAILGLDDGIILYPAHGKGSPCGARIGDRRTTTVGYERRYNPRLRLPTEDDFVREVLGTAPPEPSYYSRMKRTNAEGAPILGSPAEAAPLDPERFREEGGRPDTLVLDTREIDAFGCGHVEGAQNIPLRRAFPIWAGWMLRPEQRILLVPERSDDLERVRRLLGRVGLDQVAGRLRRGMRGWVEAGLPVARTPQLDVHELRARIEREPDAIQLLDVRSDREWNAGRIPTARHLFVADAAERVESLDRDRPVVTYCSTGFRSGIAASALQRAGVGTVYNVPGSITAWKAAGYPLDRAVPARRPAAEA